MHTYAIAIDALTRQLLGCCRDSVDDADINAIAQRALRARRISEDTNRVVIHTGLVLSNRHPSLVRSSDREHGAKLLFASRTREELRDEFGTVYAYALRLAPSRNPPEPIDRQQSR